LADAGIFLKIRGFLPFWPHVAGMWIFFRKTSFFTETFRAGRSLPRNRQGFVDVPIENISNNFRWRGSDSRALYSTD
jgi:hypothetical protein